MSAQSESAFEDTLIGLGSLFIAALAVILLSPIALLNAMLWGLTLQYVWAWFVVPVLSLDALSYWACVSLALFVILIKGVVVPTGTQKRDRLYKALATYIGHDEYGKGQLAQGILLFFAIPLIMLLTGYIGHLLLSFVS